MAHPTRPESLPKSAAPPTPAPADAGHDTACQRDADAMPCDRCGTGMFRMHAVWRCPNCGFKTDCCGW